MTVKTLIEVLELEVINDGDGLEREINGCYIGDLLSWVMSRARAGNIWITIMTNVNMVAVAVLTEVAAVVIPEGCEIPHDTIERAKNRGVVLLRTNTRAYEAAVQLSKYI